MLIPSRWTAATVAALRSGRLRFAAAGLAALGVAAAGTAPAAPEPVPASTERAVPVTLAGTLDEIGSGDETHFDDEPPPVTPAVDLEAGLNDITPDSPWAGLWGPEIEPLAGYEPQRLCIPGPRPAVRAFADLVERAFPVGRDLGIVRACDIGSRSEHKEGRAFDWGVDVTEPSEREAAHQLIAWLLATDEHGNDFAMARRLGVMYIIWDNHIWSSTAAYDGWRVYTGPSPHTDHVHLSFDWAGAMGRTSFWDVTGLEVGPGIFRDFSLDDFPEALDLGRDRYRRELGAAPGEEAPSSGQEAQAPPASQPGETEQAPPADELPEATPAPAPEPSEPAAPAPLPPPPTTAPPLGTILDPVLPDEPPITTTTTITVPLVDDVVDETTEQIDATVGAPTDP